MYLQDVDNVFDIKWNKDISYGDIFKKAEFEHSVYSFEKADVDVLRGLFNTFEEEVGKILEDKLVLPSYDCVLKCSHIFNVLDARGLFRYQKEQTILVGFETLLEMLFCIPRTKK